MSVGQKEDEKKRKLKSGNYSSVVGVGFAAGCFPWDARWLEYRVVFVLTLVSHPHVHTIIIIMPFVFGRLNKWDLEVAKDRKKGFSLVMSVDVMRKIHSKSY